MGSAVILRNLANVINLSTPLGLVLGVAGRGRWRRSPGLLVAENVRLPLVSASAMTVGSVVLVMGRTVEDAQSRIPALMEHENEHAWQYAYCLGLPFLPLYAVATLWSQVRAGDRATRNVFEKQAGLESGGYLRRATKLNRADDVPTVRPGAGRAADGDA